MPTQSNRTARIEARIAPDALAIVKRAAEMRGRGVSDFVVAAERDAAQRTIEETQMIRLSTEDQRMFIDAILNPAPPNDAMRRAAAYRDLVKASRHGPCWQQSRSRPAVPDFHAIICYSFIDERRTFVVHTMEKFSVSMPLDMASDIRATVEAGEYASTSDAIRVWRRQRLEDAERLTAIRARIRRSLDDPRPNMTLEEIDARLAERFAEAERASGDAASEG